MHKKLFKRIRGIPWSIRKVNLRKKGLFRRVSKMHISKTFNDLAEMDFVDYGDGGVLFWIYNTISRYYYTITFIGAKKKKGPPSDKSAQSVLTNLISFGRTPDIILGDKDSRCVGPDFHRFCIGKNITLQTVIRGAVRVLWELKGDIGILKPLRYR